MNVLQWVLVAVLVVSGVGVAVFGWQIHRNIQAMYDEARPVDDGRPTDRRTSM